MTEPTDMTFAAYEQKAARTANTKMFSRQDLVWNALGLAGEAGEVADTVKKLVFHKKPADREALLTEIGDALWYAAAIARNLGSSLQECAELQLAKIARRLPNGWNTDDANRYADRAQPAAPEKKDTSNVYWCYLYGKRPAKYDALSMLDAAVLFAEDTLEEDTLSARVHVRKHDEKEVVLVNVFRKVRYIAEPFKETLNRELAETDPR